MSIATPTPAPAPMSDRERAEKVADIFFPEKASRWRPLLISKIEAALATVRAEGAREMRERCAKLLDTRVAELADRIDHWTAERDHSMVQRCQTAGLTAAEAAKKIRALPLDPTPAQPDDGMEEPRD